jgi:hypothetical protein
MMRHASHRSLGTYVLFALLAVQGVIISGFVGAAIVLVNRSANVAQDKGAQAVTLAGLTTQNRDEVTRLGGTPIGPDPGKILRGDPGPAGQDGATGATGSSGSAGPPGRDGRDATPAQVAAAVAAYMKAHPTKSGPVGPAGQDGRDGVDGQSPACLAEPDQCRGATGETGKAGADGADGHPPAAWHWTDPVTKTSFDCRRDASSPDSAPAYACTVVP